MLPFVHEPLDLDHQSFRLVRLFKGNSPKDWMMCELFHARIRNTLYTIDYDALSYTWGGTNKSFSIEINGKEMRVTANLYEALCHLRNKDDDRIIWIDAICIDQGNHKERRHQVEQMALIYETARQVVIWLGLATPDTDPVIHSMEGLEKHALSYPCSDWKPSDDRWRTLWMSVQKSLNIPRGDCRLRQRDGFEFLLRHEWFRRVWVLQEVAKARSARIVCGTKSVSARILATILRLVGIKPRSHQQDVLNIMPGPSRKHSWWSRARDLCTLLSRFRGSQASDERDLIYALLGISSDAHSASALTPDNTKSLHEVFRVTVAFLLGLNSCDLAIGCIPRWSLSGFRDALKSLGEVTFSKALQTEHDRLVWLLFRQGKLNFNKIDFSRSGRYGRTLLPRAACTGQAPIVQTLLGLNSTVINAPDWVGQTPLSVAAQRGHNAVVRLLLDTDGVEVDLADKHGRTPLYWAAQAGEKTVVKILLDTGKVTVGLRHVTSGHTPLSIAIWNGRQSVVRLLRQYGAVIHVHDD